MRFVRVGPDPVVIEDSNGAQIRVATLALKHPIRPAGVPFDVSNSVKVTCSPSLHAGLSHVIRLRPQSFLDPAGNSLAFPNGASMAELTFYVTAQAERTYFIYNLLMCI